MYAQIHMERHVLKTGIERLSEEADRVRSLQALICSANTQ